MPNKYLSPLNPFETLFIQVVRKPIWQTKPSYTALCSVFQAIYSYNKVRIRFFRRLSGTSFAF